VTATRPTAVEADRVDYGTSGTDYLILIIPAVVLLVIGLIVLSLYTASKRRNALSALAQSMGWTFSADDMVGIPQRYGLFNCLNTGHSRHADNVMEGRFGDIDFRGFDYRYTTGSGKDESTHNLSAVIAQAKYPLKQLFIRPEHFGDRVAGMLGFEDIDFEWDEFNRAFYVKAADKEFAYDAINQKMMEFLMDNKGWTTQIAGMDMIVYTGGVFSPEEFQSAIEFARVFLGLLPDYLADKLSGEQDKT
jgi:hypothetical protein